MNEVNYVSHLNNINEMFSEENRLTPSHLVIYNALFQIWNKCKWHSSLSINRNDVMRLSKIGSVNTYTKCLRDLDKFGYLKYKPSKNPLKGSVVEMLRFDQSSDKVVREYCASTGHSTGLCGETLYKQLNKETIKLIEKNPDLINRKLAEWINSNESDNLNNGKSKKGKPYRQFAHLKISQKEFKTLNEIYSKTQIDDILDRVENYKNNKKYKSLYLTAKNWLKREHPHLTSKDKKEENEGGLSEYEQMQRKQEEILRQAREGEI